MDAPDLCATIFGEFIPALLKSGPVEIRGVAWILGGQFSSLQEQAGEEQQVAQ